MSQTQGNVFLWTQKWLEASGLPHQAYVLCESTSTIAKKEVASTPSFYVRLAAQQTHGRGRGDHTWASPPEGSALLTTWSWHIQQPPQHLTAPLVGLYVYRALNQTWRSLPWSLKAPNDLFLADKKVGGLLVETITSGYAHTLLIGLGLNVFAAPGHVPEATCISDHLKETLTESKWQEFMHNLQQGLNSAVHQAHIHELSTPLRQDLLQALKRHPQFRELRDVSPDGDLILPDRTIDWYSI
ncbi:MAG: biotin--[acetyl-CoA-carboxylase] ligase [Bdellovibrionales bacterium]